MVKNKIRQIISTILVLVLVAGCFAVLPQSIRQVSAQETNNNNNTWEICESGADDKTVLPGVDDVDAGKVWTDKSVADNTDGSFDIALRSFGIRQAMEYEDWLAYYKPINVVFVLDTSSSMSYNSLIAMIDATVEAGKMILNANPDNKVAVVYFDETARHANSAQYAYNTGNNRDGATTSNWVNRQVSIGWVWAESAGQLDQLTISYATGGTTYRVVPRTVSATNIVAGLNLATELLTAQNTNDAESVIVLMSDGAPNRYINTNGGISSDGGADGGTISAKETIIKAAEVANSGVSIYTVGYNINRNNLAWVTLNPSSTIGYLALGIDPRDVKISGDVLS